MSIRSLAKLTLRWVFHSKDFVLLVAFCAFFVSSPADIRAVESPARLGAAFAPKELPPIGNFKVALEQTSPEKNKSPSAPPQPVDRPTKRKAGFLAAAGLAILSLLVLATGLALLRAFRQR